MRTEIDNPGGGDCGYLALSVGLIETIQRELKTNNGRSPCFEQWQSQGMNGVSLNEIRNFDLAKLKANPRGYQTAMLDSLQMSLRAITAKSEEDEFKTGAHLARLSGADKPNLFDDSIRQDLQKSSIYGKFSALVDHYLQNPNTKPSDHYNVLATSPAVCNLAKQCAQEIKQTGAALPPDDLAAHGRLQQMVVAREILANSAEVMGANLSTRRAGRWADDVDLRTVATRLNFNLSISGQPQGTSNPSQPTIRLNNKGNNHWTTAVSNSSLGMQATASTAVPLRTASPAKPKVTVTAASKPITSPSALRPVATADSYRKLASEMEKLLQAGKLGSKKRRSGITAHELDAKTEKEGAAKAKKGESDEDFAKRLQKAELEQYRSPKP